MVRDANRSRAHGIGEIPFEILFVPACAPGGNASPAGLECHAVSIEA